MSPQLRMLLWKEWRERRAQFLVCMLWVVGGIGYAVVHAWSRGDRLLASSIGTTYVFGLLMPVFIAMRTSLGELTDGTRSFTGALPVSGQRLGWIRLGGGLAVLVLPILAEAAIISLFLALGWMEIPGSAANRGSPIPLSAIVSGWRAAAAFLSSAISLYLLLSLLGTALRTEAHAGFVGAAVAILWFLGFLLVQALHHRGLPAVAAWVDAISPWGMLLSCVEGSDGSERGLYKELLISSRMLGPLLVQAILQFAMAVWFVRRYARRLPGRDVEAVREAPSLHRRPWSFALPNHSIALAWLTLRQAVPMCLPGLLIACAMAILVVVNEIHHRGVLLQRFADDLLQSMSLTGLLWAVVVGAGVFSAEIDWRVGEFWRTRPIPFWRLFGVKSVVGLLAVLLVLDATTIMVSWGLRSWNWASYKSLNWPYIACIMPLHSVMFAVAVAWTCVLRRPVLAGMAAFVSFVLFEAVIHWSPTAARSLDPLMLYQCRAREIGFTADYGYLVVAAGMVVIFVASITIAGLALRWYDPRRQSG